MADTSVLLALARIDAADVLPALYGNILIPPAVRTEFTSHAARPRQFHGLAMPPWVQEQAPTTSPAGPLVGSDLHAGEREVLTLALELSADSVLMDEAAGRLVAERLRLRFTGTVGILLAAKARRLLPAVGPCLDRLEREARFWIAPGFRLRVLQAAGESP